MVARRIELTAVQQQVDPKVLRAESMARVFRALELVERAQNSLDSACAELSTLNHGHPHQQAVSKMADKVKDLWWRVNKFCNSGQFVLDDDHVRLLLQRRANAAVPSTTTTTAEHA